MAKLIRSDTITDRHNVCTCSCVTEGKKSEKRADRKSTLPNASHFS